MRSDPPVIVFENSTILSGMSENWSLRTGQLCSVGNGLPEMDIAGIIPEERRKTH